ncbi:putative cation-transporting ATPase F [Streptococcus constellatus]|uniref:Putative cation-transporting ATPase F n=1 Tax=Streptococcus constellatus TaxID=76860 RepID=A0A564TPV5_STRCV|nr:cation-translocating P-type ATPase [Streptococcus constellatus]VUX02235.1 putative cation-transporting ATPase F [Streptococcus gordonii]VUX09220.1 putative cation-transporting ATPase F [Streptococcus constellatus]
MSKDIYIGLSQKEVEERIQKGLVNKVTVSTEKTIWQIIQSNVFTYFNFIFFVLAVLLIIVQSWNNLLFLPIVIINSLIGIVQELRARKTLSKMQLLHHNIAIAIRDGKEVQLDTKDLVQDDLVLFSAGDQIYADARLVSGDLKVNESQLTGEADEIAKKVNDTVMSGSFVVSGKAYACLEKVGDDSYINQLTLKAKEVSGKEESEMVRSVNNLVKAIGFLIIPLGLILFFQSYVTNHESFQVSIVSTVGAIIGMIPEGLYLLMTLALALGAVSLARQKVLLNSMKGIESLSRVDILCVDKTGTITENTMKVTQVRSVHQNEQISQEALKHYLAVSPDENETIVAIRDFFESEIVEESWTVLSIFPFSSKTKFGAISFKEGNFILGAPEFVLKEKLEEYRSYIQKYAESGTRVLVFAESKEPLVTGDLTQTVEPLLFILLENPIRENAAETFSYFALQGVEVKVISGDNPVTVAAVAAKAEIPHAENYIDAQRLDTDEKIAQAVEKYTVFGRVTPQQKQKLVQALQANQHKVAMTGDGVNDILAMKTANCSIAMESGNNATKQIAQVVLLDSDFSHMPHIVTEGRRVVNNIQRSASLFLVKNIFSISLAILSSLFAFTYPLQASQVSLISAFTIGIPGFMLALEPNKQRIRGRFIRTVLQNAIPAALVDLLAVLIVMLCGRIFRLSTQEVATSSIILLAVVGFIIIIKLIQPLNRMKTTVLLFNMIGLIVSGILFHSIFSLSKISPITIILTIILSLMLESLMRLFQYVTNKLFARFDKVLIRYQVAKK